MHAGFIEGACWETKPDQSGERSQRVCPNFFFERPWLEEWYELYMNAVSENADYLFPNLHFIAGHARSSVLDMNQPAVYDPALHASRSMFHNVVLEE